MVTNIPFTWVGFNTDIQDQKLKETALRDNEVLRQTQRRLEAEKEFSQTLLENSIDGIMALDAEGNVTAWNKTLEDLSGRRKAEVLGKPVGQVLFPAETAVAGKATSVSQAPQEKNILAGTLQRALQGDPVTLLEQDNPFAVTEGLYEIILKPLPKEGSRVTGVLGIVREVLSAVVHTQEEERQRIAESLHNGLGQLLFATRLALQAYFARVREAGTAETQALDKVYPLIKEAIIQSKVISADLAPLPCGITGWKPPLGTGSIKSPLKPCAFGSRWQGCPSG
jgi:PAS domain-containing protein